MRALSYSGYEKRREANNNNCQLTRERERERERAITISPSFFSAAVFHLRLEAHFFPSPFPIIRANETTFRYKQ